MDRGPWWATVHGVTKSRTQLSTTKIVAFFALGTLLSTGDTVVDKKDQKKSCLLVAGSLNIGENTYL